MGEITNPVERLAREPTHDDIARRAYSSLVARIRGEYDEMPGLRLTFAQACRLWQVDARTCQMLLEQLVRESFLHKTLDGAYIALPSPRQQAKAQLQEHVRFPRSA